jgi:hypothetical protein
MGKGDGDGNGIQNKAAYESTDCEREHQLVVIFILKHIIW